MHNENMKYDSVKWGIIGCGDVTEVKSGPAFSKIENSELVAVMRRDETKVLDYAKRHNVQKWYTHAEDLIHDSNVNAIYIATPPSTHKDYTLMALAANKPVYVEKPMALNFAECFEMIKASQKAEVPLFVAYYRRALPGYLKIKELIEQNAIGKVLLVSIRMYSPPKPGDDDKDLPWRVRPEIAGGGHFYDLASHQLDYLDYLFGTITHVAGFAANQSMKYPAEDAVTGSFIFESGVIASGVWCFSTSIDAEIDEIQIVGEKGKITFSTFNFTPIILEANGIKSEFTNDRPMHVQQPLIQTVVDELRGVGTCSSTGITAARTNWVMGETIKNYYRDDCCRR